MFAFAGPQEVRELELGTDMASVNNLLGFLEKARPMPSKPCQYWWGPTPLLATALR